MRTFSVCVVMMLVTGCASVGVPTKYCGPNDTALYLSKKQIDLLTDEQVKDILAKNEALYARGCAKPTK